MCEYGCEMRERIMQKKISKRIFTQFDSFLENVHYFFPFERFPTRKSDKEILGEALFVFFDYFRKETSSLCSALSASPESRQSAL